MSPSDKKPVAIVGAGGHAKVLLDALRAAGRPVRGLCDTDPEKAAKHLPGEIILGDDDAGLALPVDGVAIAIGLGAVQAGNARKALFERYTQAGFEMATIIHPSAVIATHVVIAPGAQIMAGAVIQPGVEIGRNVVINTRASVDHDCRIGDHAFVCPGVTLCGGVVIGAGAHIGAGATVLEYRTVGVGTTVGAAALVNHDLGDDITATGVPASVRQS